nr:recombinase [Escherichia coli]
MMNSQTTKDISKRLVRTVLIFTESSDQLSRATDRVPG